MAEHGTTARYVKHKRDGEESCIECKAAWRKWQAKRRKDAATRLLRRS